jgi:hypothetical protein
MTPGSASGREAATAHHRQKQTDRIVRIAFALTQV